MDLGFSYDKIHIDSWDSFLTAFKTHRTCIGKYYTVGIEGNNNRLRHRIRCIFRRTYCFSKKLLNHLKAFELAFHYINYG
ncbi:IS1 family transposase [Moraxella sp. ZY210820]|uniref:IS1 family transposase n=1 Tax=unclassified Moraxella TaxID=2685852 RepID=UPI00351E859E